MKNKKILAIGLCGAICLGIAGVTYASALASDTPKVSTSETGNTSSADILYQDIGEGVIVHRLPKVDRVENLDVVAMLQKGIAALNHDAAFRKRFVKIENGKVTNYFQFRNSPLSHHHALTASSCPLRCPCFPC